MGVERSAGESASRSLKLVAGADAAHVCAALWWAIPEKRTPITLVLGLALNLLVIGLLLWLAASVRRNERILGALLMVMLLLVGGLAAGGAVLAMGYKGTWQLALVQIVLLAALMLALVRLLIASARTGARSGV